MDGIFNRREQAYPRPAGLASRLVRALPRIVVTTAIAVVVTMGSLLMVPTTYQARLTLALPPNSEPTGEIAYVLSQPMLADIVSRLPAELVADLRDSGGEVLDTTALIRRRLTLAPSGDAGMAVRARGGSASHAATLAKAVAISYGEANAQLPPGPAAAVPPATAVTTSSAAPAGKSGQVRLLRQRLNLAWQNRVRLEEKAKLITRLVDGGNFTALALEADALPVLGHLLEELAVLESERKAMAVTLLPNHPSMRNMQDRIEAMNAEISAQAQVLV
ncbi:MAG: hypothetical protein L0H19_06840, partial [Salinisphaera sp.]|nr:hypothetical protein [Salinisphaera sp.]